MKWLRFLIDFPDSWREGEGRGSKVSGTRVSASCCIAVGCLVAIKGGNPATVAALIGGGGVALWTRSEAGK